MNNRINEPRASEQIILRNLSNQANVAEPKFHIFRPSKFSSRNLKDYPKCYFHNVDNNYVGMGVDLHKIVSGDNTSINDVSTNHVRGILVTSETSRLEKTFRSFADKWYEELNSEAESSLTNITSSMNYLRILGLTPRRQVVTLLLKELQITSAPWFLALEILTGESTIGKENSGNFIKMSEDWVSWGFEIGYL